MSNTDTSSLIDTAMTELDRVRNKLISDIGQALNDLTKPEAGHVDFENFWQNFININNDFGKLVIVEKELNSLRPTLSTVNDPIAADVERILKLPVMPNSAKPKKQT